MEKKVSRSYPLRMPSHVRKWYEQESVTNKRSLNSELVIVLEARMNRLKSSRKNAKR